MRREVWESVEQMRMKQFIKFGFIAVCGCVLAACLLAIVLVGILRLEPSGILYKLNSGTALHLLLFVIVAECCFFTNDLLAYLSQREGSRLWFDFSEVKFRYDLDNKNRAIPLKTKLSQLYPITIAIVLTSLAILLVK